MSNAPKRTEQQPLTTGAAIAPTEPPIQEVPSESTSPLSTAPLTEERQRSASPAPAVSAPSTPGIQELSNPLDGAAPLAAAAVAATPEPTSAPVGSEGLRPFAFTPAAAPSTGSVRQLNRSESGTRSVGLNSTSLLDAHSSSSGGGASSYAPQQQPSTSSRAREGERNYVFARLRAAPDVAHDASRLHAARARGQRKMSDSNLPSAAGAGAGMSRGRLMRPFGLGRKRTSQTAAAADGDGDGASAVDEAGHAILSRDFERKGREEAQRVRVEDAKREGARLGREAALAQVRNAVLGFVGSGSEDEGRGEEGAGGEALRAFQALMGSSDEEAKQRHVDHGTHPGLAGRRMGTGAGEGPRVPARIAGGPGAPATLRQASNAGPALSVSAARELNSGAHADEERASRASRRDHHSQQQQRGEAREDAQSAKPSMLGASRFPGGRAMSAQGSVGEQASLQLASHAHSAERDSSTLASPRPDSGTQHSAHDMQQGAPHKSGSPLARHRWRMREFLAELLASTLLLTIGSSVNCQVHLSQDLSRTPSDSAGTFSSINFAWGFAVLCTIHVAGGISGAHANPAVTLSLALFRGFPLRLVPAYVGAQLLGSFIGAAIAYGLYLPAIDAWEGQGIRTVFGDKATASLFVTIPTEQTTPLTAFFNEVVGSAVLAIMVFAVGDESNSPPGDGMSGLILGLTVTMIGMSLGWLSGYAINAARDLGPRIFLSMVGYPSLLWTHNHAWWLYGPILGTLTGAVLGSVMYDLTIFQGFDSPLNRRWHRPRVHSMVRGLRRALPKKQERQQAGEQLGREEERAERGGTVDSAANSTKQAVQRRWAEDAKAESGQSKEA